MRPAAKEEFRMKTIPSTTAQYMEALHLIEIDISVRQRELLTVHWSCRNHAAIAPDLAKMLREKNHGTVNIYYGRLGKLLREALNRRRTEGETLESAIFMSFEWRDDGHWILVMHPQFAEALVKLGWVRARSQG
jgi:hypothetical protein